MLKQQHLSHTQINSCSKKTNSKTAATNKEGWRLSTKWGQKKNKNKNTEKRNELHCLIIKRLFAVFGV